MLHMLQSIQTFQLRRYVQATLTTNNRHISRLHPIFQMTLESERISSHSIEQFSILETSLHLHMLVRSNINIHFNPHLT